MSAEKVQYSIPVTCSWEGVTQPLIIPEGFREYDGRWRFPDEINLPGALLLGRGLGTLMNEQNIHPRIIVGCDFRSYSRQIAQALTIGLINCGIDVVDIGTVLSPMAYFSRVHLGIDAVAMVTASHNPNGWTGLKAGFRHPQTLSETEMKRLREIVIEQEFSGNRISSYRQNETIFGPYADDLCEEVHITRPLKIVCAAGNGTAGQFVPSILERCGVEVIPLHTTPDSRFPNYNPNPESLEMLHDIGRNVRETHADLGFGFDGDGDRLGVVDNTGAPIFSDKIGLLIARALAARHPGARFIVDIKSTGLFVTDPVLSAHDAQTEYWKTGHSHMKWRLAETGAIAGFEKSGHFYFGNPIGRGYDDALLAAITLCQFLDDMPDASLSDAIAALPQSWITPTMSPHCRDTDKYETVERIINRLKSYGAQNGRLGGQRIVDIVTVNGARCQLENGSWALVRASSNTPNLVVVCESMSSENEMRRIFEDFDQLIRQEGTIGPYDQSI